MKKRTRSHVQLLYGFLMVVRISYRDTQWLVNHRLCARRKMQFVTCEHGETGRTGTDDIVDAVIEEMQNRENRRIEAEKQEILADLDLYGI